MSKIAIDVVFHTTVVRQYTIEVEEDEADAIIEQIEDGDYDDELPDFDEWADLEWDIKSRQAYRKDDGDE